MSKSCPPRAFVTGSTGFVGTHLTRVLVRQGWEVHCLVRDNNHGRPVEHEATRHLWDGSTDEMMRILAAAQADTVFHLASLFLAQHRPKDIGPLVDSNIRTGMQMLEAMAAAGVRRLINAGTSWQHYLNEDYNPVCLYAATKQAFKDILRYYAEARDIRAISLSLYDTYGPQDSRPKLFSMLRAAARDGSTIEMSPGEQLLDLVYIDDAVEAFLAAEKLLDASASHGMDEYAVSSGQPVSLKEVVSIYSRCTKQNIDVRWGGRPYRDREVMVPWSRGRLLPTWRTTISLEEGIRRMEANP